MFCAFALCKNITCIGVELAVRPVAVDVTAPTPRGMALDMGLSPGTRDIVIENTLDRYPNSQANLSDHKLVPFMCLWLHQNLRSSSTPLWKTRRASEIFRICLLSLRHRSGKTIPSAPVCLGNSRDPPSRRDQQRKRTGRGQILLGTDGTYPRCPYQYQQQRAWHRCRHQNSRPNKSSSPFQLPLFPPGTTPSFASSLREGRFYLRGGLNLFFFCRPD